MNIWTDLWTDREVSRRRGRAVTLALLAVSALAACGGNSQKPPALAPQTVSSVASPENTTASMPEPPTRPPVRPASAIEKTIVIDDGGETDDRKSLVAAAEAERERRATSDGPTVVINDKNLKSQAIGQLTVANPGPRPEAGDEDSSTASSEAPPAEDSPEAEDYWRERILEARQAWREVVDEIDELEGEVNLLRRRFYDEDDPYYRDSQIKPAWDRALDRLRLARLLADEAEELVVLILEDGRRAGALPGWMREGVELEPLPRGPAEARAKKLEEYEPGEPQIYDPDGDGRR